jgi:Protein of unknown function (DUF2442)
MVYDLEWLYVQARRDSGGNMRRAVSVTAGPGYILTLRFDDGTSGEISIADRLLGPMFKPLKDESLFAQATIDRFGVITWPNGAGLDPRALYTRLRANDLENGYSAMAADEERENEAKAWIDGLTNGPGGRPQSR